MQFPIHITSRINKVFETAYRDGRYCLYEYEVYCILKEIGLKVPEFILVKNIAAVKERMLEKFGQSVVIKIVSPQIAHKQKLGGVKIINNIGTTFVRSVMTRMKDEVLSHFENDKKPEITGFLLTEFIPHAQSIGYETLMGFKEDAAFGPVLAVSKGGDDAEFFAKYYDPANLILPPINYQEALTLVNSLNVMHKFEQIGHPEYAEQMSKALSALSCLAYQYSSAAEVMPGYIIKEMDINPFVFTEDGVFIAIDGFAQFVVPAKDYKKPVYNTCTDNMKAFFNPSGVAVIGVSANLDKYSMGREIARLLHNLGRDDVYFVNEKGGSIRFDEKEYILYKSLKDIPGKIELAVYSAPAQYTVDFFKDLPKDCPKAVILISGIPSNIKYPDFVKQLDAVRPDGVRVIGPNCMGVYYAPDGANKGINTFFLNEERLSMKHSVFCNTVLLTQSGALAITEIDKLRKSPLFKAVVSFGNKYDCRITDLIAYFARDEAVDIISLYIEGLEEGEGRQFFQMVQKIDKPLIVYKSGKTEAGARAAASHTASMSGSYEVFKAACNQAGVVLAENIDDHYDFVKIFSLLADKKPWGNRVAGILNAGFEATVGADELKNLKQAKFTHSTIERINNINKHGLVDTSTSFLDVTPMSDDRLFADYVEAVLQDEKTDCVFVAFVPHTEFLKSDPVTCRDHDSIANLLVGLSKKYVKPMVVSVNAGQYYQEFAAVMEENGLPVYPDIKAAIKSLDKFVSYYQRLY